MEELNNSLQENIIILLTFNTEASKIIFNTIKPELFGNTYYRNIASKAISYIASFNEAPKEHIADLLEYELNNEKTKDIYTQILQSVYENKDSVNKEYIIDALEKFIRQQNLKIAVRDAVEALQRNDFDNVEFILDKARKKNQTLFDPGVFIFNDVENTLSPIYKEDEDVILTGIKELDRMEICPAPKELFTLVGRSGAGKTWFLIHLGKMALLQRKKILHISLELSEERLKARYLQALFGVALRYEDIQNQNAFFKTDRFGCFNDVDFRDIKNLKTFKDKDINVYLRNELDKVSIPKRMVIREFPTGSLTINQLVTYLDNLESFYNFIPDIILLDYLDLMSIDADKLRVDLGKTAVDLRGIAVERNLAMVTVAQTNRAGEGRQVLTRKHLAEDFSKVRISDNLITYNQVVDLEQEKGYARLFVDKARNTRTGDIVLISQNYSIGQFCLNSCHLDSKGDKYWSMVEGK